MDEHIANRLNSDARTIKWRGIKSAAYSVLEEDDEDMVKGLALGGLGGHSGCQ
jgi:hypothetical protein